MNFKLEIFKNVKLRFYALTGSLPKGEVYKQKRRSSSRPPPHYTEAVVKSETDLL
jgi:hypothetical protein